MARRPLVVIASAAAFLFARDIRAQAGAATISPRPKSFSAMRTRYWRRTGKLRRVSQIPKNSQEPKRHSSPSLRKTRRIALPHAFSARPRNSCLAVSPMSTSTPGFFLSSSQRVLRGRDSIAFKGSISTALLNPSPIGRMSFTSGSCQRVSDLFVAFKRLSSVVSTDNGNSKCSRTSKAFGNSLLVSQHRVSSFLTVVAADERSLQGIRVEPSSSFVDREISERSNWVALAAELGR